MKRGFTVATSIVLDKDEVIKIVKDYLVARGVMDSKEAQSVVGTFSVDSKDWPVVTGLRFDKADTQTESLQV